MLYSEQEFAFSGLLRAFLILAFIVGLARSAGAQDGIPPVRQLIAETLAICDADREGNISALNDLAAAQCYLREFEAARKNLLPYTKDDVFQQTMHQQCACIEIEITGSADSVPKALWDDGFGFMHCDAAMAYLDRGEIEKAAHHIKEIPPSVHSAFNVSGVKLIQKLIDLKEIELCRKTLVQWASRYEKTESVFEYRDSNRVPKLVAWLIEFGEKPAAVTLCDHWHNVVRAETDVDECGEFIGRCWAEYALGMAAMNDKKAAGVALDEAQRWMDRARAAKADQDNRSGSNEFAPLRSLEFAQAYAAIAARRVVVLGGNEGEALYSRAYEIALLAVNSKYGEHVFEEIIDEQLTAGDETGALETLKRVQAPRTIARSWKRICGYELARGRAASARAAARLAVQALDRDGFEPLMAQEMAPVAATAALAGEKELARKLFQRSLALSEVNETPKFNHPWIAGIQVHAGLFEDAYRTIQSVEEPADRTRPMAELCRALAKAQYQANREK
jgi:hypothetical protein